MRERGLVGFADIKQTIRSKSILSMLSLLILSFLSTPVSAITSISQSYTTTDKLSLGSIVSIKKNTSDQVEATATTNVDNMLGVIIGDNNSILTFVKDQTNQVQVSTSGITATLVSNVNGEIAQGDPITASPIKGVGMKATGNSKVIGIAQGKPLYSGNAQSYTDENGLEKQFTLGQVDVLINVAYYYKESEKTIIPAAVQNVANALAGKKVSPVPILVSAAIFLVMIIVVASIIFSMVKNSIISIGRNPMAQSAVWRDVIQLSLLVLAVLTVGFISIYLILTRF